MTEPVFEVTYGCGNCGNEWSEELPPRVDVRDSSSVEDVRVYARDCEELGMNNCECCYRVACSVCELSDDVYVESRDVLDDPLSETTSRCEVVKVRTPIVDGDSDE
jgi:hypothetical protein